MKPKLEPNQILLTFESTEQADTIRTICRRRVLQKVQTLPKYRWEKQVP